MIAAILLACLAFSIFDGGTHNAYAASISQPPLETISISTFVSPHYTLFDLSTPETVFGNITVTNVNVTAPLQTRLLSTFRASSLIASATLFNGTRVTITPITISGTSGNLFGYYLTLPSTTTNVSVSIIGTQTGEVLLFRHVTNLPRISLGGLNVPQQYDARLYIPTGSIIWQAFNVSTASRAGVLQPRPSQTVSGAPLGYVGYELAPNIATIVMQSKLFIPASVAIISVSALALIVVALGMFSTGRRILEEIILVIRRLLNRIIKAIMVKLPRRIGVRQTGSITRKILFKRKFRSSDLLVLFISCGVLMVGIATMGGPNPTVQAYVIADPSLTHQIHQSLDASLGPTQIITPSQDYSDFAVMSSVGRINLLVVSSYPTIALPQIEPFILQGAQNVPVIVVDNSSDPTFAGVLKALYPGDVITVHSAENLTVGESQLLHSLVVQSRVHNTLGLGLTEKEYTEIVVVEGGLSFLLVLLGFAYLGARIAEPNSDQTLTRIALTLTSGIFVFYFCEVAYVATSATLQFPLSLHAVISGAQTLTAVGEFGHVIHLPFGGGTTPRLLSGVLGLLLGSLVFVRGTSVVFDKRSLVTIVVLAVLLLANPFAIGTFVFQGLLLFVGNIPLGGAFASALTFKGFLYGIGAALGGQSSATFLMSAGKMAYFAGLVPLAFIRRMGKTTATLTLLICTVLVGDGGVRVGEMTPDKTVIGVLPGIIAGVSIALVLLLVSALERYVTSNYVKSRP